MFKGRGKSLDFIGFLGWKRRIYTSFTPLEDRIGKAEIIMQDGKGDQATQNDQLDVMIEKGVDVLCVTW